MHKQEDQGPSTYNEEPVKSGVVRGIRLWFIVSHFTIQTGGNATLAIKRPSKHEDIWYHDGGQRSQGWTLNYYQKSPIDGDIQALFNLEFRALKAILASCLLQVGKMMAV